MGYLGAADEVYVLVYAKGLTHGFVSPSKEKTTPICRDDGVAYIASAIICPRGYVGFEVEIECLPPGMTAQ